MWSFLKISLIVAMDKKRVIGKDNDIPWRISSDWEYVKNTTKGHAIILGRKNLQSIGRALPDRRNIILTRDKNFNFKDCEIAHSIKDALAGCEGEERVAIVGGAKIFEQSMDLADIIHFTRIHHIFDADTFFPAIDPDKWIEVESEYHEPDEKNLFSYSFITYRKA